MLQKHKKLPWINTSPHESTDELSVVREKNPPSTARALGMQPQKFLPTHNQKNGGCSRCQTPSSRFLSGSEMESSSINVLGTGIEANKGCPNTSHSNPIIPLKQQSPYILTKGTPPPISNYQRPPSSNKKLRGKFFGNGGPISPLNHSRPSILVGRLSSGSGNHPSFGGPSSSSNNNNTNKGGTHQDEDDPKESLLPKNILIQNKSPFPKKVIGPKESNHRRRGTTDLPTPRQNSSSQSKNQSQTTFPAAKDANRDRGDPNFKEPTHSHSKFITNAPKKTVSSRDTPPLYAPTENRKSVDGDDTKMRKLQKKKDSLITNRNDDLATPKGNKKVEPLSSKLQQGEDNDEAPLGFGFGGRQQGPHPPDFLSSLSLIPPARGEKFFGFGGQLNMVGNPDNEELVSLVETIQTSIQASISQTLLELLTNRDSFLGILLSEHYSHHHVRGGNTNYIPLQNKFSSRGTQRNDDEYQDHQSLMKKLKRPSFLTMISFKPLYLKLGISVLDSITLFPTAVTGDNILHSSDQKLTQLYCAYLYSLINDETSRDRMRDNKAPSQYEVDCFLVQSSPNACTDSQSTLRDFFNKNLIGISEISEQIMGRGRKGNSSHNITSAGESVKNASKKIDLMDWLIFHCGGWRKSKELLDKKFADFFHLQPQLKRCHSPEIINNGHSSSSSLTGSQKIIGDLIALEIELTKLISKSNQIISFIEYSKKGRSSSELSLLKNKIEQIFDQIYAIEGNDEQKIAERFLNQYIINRSDTSSSSSYFRSPIAQPPLRSNLSPPVDVEERENDGTSPPPQRDQLENSNHHQNHQKNGEEDEGGINLTTTDKEIIIEEENLLGEPSDKEEVTPTTTCKQLTTAEIGLLTYCISYYQLLIFYWQKIGSIATKALRAGALGFFVDFTGIKPNSEQFSEMMPGGGNQPRGIGDGGKTNSPGFWFILRRYSAMPYLPLEVYQRHGGKNGLPVTLKEDIGDSVDLDLDLALEEDMYEREWVSNHCMSIKKIILSLVEC